MSPEQQILLVIAVPLVLGAIALVLGRRLAPLARLLALAGTIVPLCWAVLLWLHKGSVVWTLPKWKFLGDLTYLEPYRDIFRVDRLNGFMLAGVCFFGLITVLYSIGSVKRDELANGRFYGHILIALAAAREYANAKGVYVVAILSGLTDMDAITLSTARISKTDPTIAAEGWRLIVAAVGLPVTVT